MTAKPESVQDAEQNEQNEQTVAKAELDAFEAALSETPKQEAPPEKAPAQKQEPITEPPKPETVTEPDVLPGLGMTAEQLRSTLAKVSRLDKFEKDIQKIYGKFGELQMQKPDKFVTALKEGKLKRFNEEYPELVDSLKEDLKDPEETPKPVDIDHAVSQRVAEKVGEITEAFEKRMISLKHEDWEAEVKTPDFSLWMQTLPEPDQQSVLTSTDAGTVIKYLDDFKGWKEKLSKRDQNTSRNKLRLEAAIVPQGTPGEPPASQTEQQAFDAVFAGHT